MRYYAIPGLKLLLFSFCTCIIFACSPQKDTALGRGMQNLTARYNYIYNSGVILSNHQQTLLEENDDNYDQILPLYIGTEPDNDQPGGSLNLKPMEDIIRKAQAIILEKSGSNYLDDAYILLGKANFFNGNYYNAAEYFDYTAKTYRNNTGSYLEALNWKARSLMQLKRMSEANNVLDTLEAVIPAIKQKKKLADAYATLAQMCIYLKNHKAATSYLKDAIRATTQSQNRIRWTYVLAQLQESQKQYKEASSSYKKVQHSNAPFEMYFNANLSQIRLRHLQGIPGSDSDKELLSLLKDDKNTEYNDQIYFQVAENHFTKSEYGEAEKFYGLSIRRSTSNPYQKGLSYLRMADLNFKQLKNYPKAKAYYDSTVNTLPKSYPGYDLILKKSQNLRYLTNRLELISIEDTLQYIAQQPEEVRATLIDALASPAVEIQPVQPANTGFGNTATLRPGTGRQQAQSTFYFSNPNAVSMGFNDFKKRWGNRKLENNWRQSVRSSSQETTQEIIANTSNDSEDPDLTVPLSKDKETLIRQYTESLPVNPEKLSVSNQKILDAYYELANFYLQELQDPSEAERTYQTLLKRFPQNRYQDAIYYSLFLINKSSNEAKANEYREKVLRDFPGSVYAKTIIDPSFSVKQSELEAAVNKKYNEVFDLYLKKEFPDVIHQVNENGQRNKNHLSPQFAYLKAIAIGRSSNVDSLISAFNFITTQFPDDKIITPLVKEHLTYINAHLSDFRKRPVALIDFDPNEPPFIQQNTSAPIIAQNQQVSKTAAPAAPTVSRPIPDTAVPETSVKPAEPPKVNGPFTTAKSTVYYYVIDVSDASLTLSSSRFGIGQFNRGNYADSNLKHQLKEFDNEQLIYVGNFSNFEDAETYSGGITPQLKQIMKVPAGIYTSFIISRENFDKISSKRLLDQYLEFYKSIYQK